MAETSSTSSINRAWARALRSITASPRARSSPETPWRRRMPTQPSTALSGVRSSWASTARNSSFARLAASAASRAASSGRRPVTASGERSVGVARRPERVPRALDQREIDCTRPHLVGGRRRLDAVLETVAQPPQALGVVGDAVMASNDASHRSGPAAHRGGDVDTRDLRRLVEHDDVDAAALAASQGGHVGQDLHVEVGGERLLKRAAKRRGGTDHERDGPMCRPGRRAPLGGAGSSSDDPAECRLAASARPRVGPGGVAEFGRRRDASRPTTSPYPTRFSSARPEPVAPHAHQQRPAGGTGRG